MNADVDQTLAFDESCAPEETIVRRNGSPSPETQPVEQDRLSRLDLYMWILCFLFGSLFGRQVLPVLESLWSIS